MRLVSIGVLILGGALTAAHNLPSLAYLHGDQEARDFALSLLDGTPEGAVLLANWHRATPLWYLQQVENVRPDVEVVYVYPEGAEPLGETWARRIGGEVEAGRTVVVQAYHAVPYAETGLQMCRVGDTACMKFLRSVGRDTQNNTTVWSGY